MPRPQRSRASSRHPFPTSTPDFTSRYKIWGCTGGLSRSVLRQELQTRQAQSIPHALHAAGQAKVSHPGAHGRKIRERGAPEGSPRCATRGTDGDSVKTLDHEKPRPPADAKIRIKHGHYNGVPSQLIPPGGISALSTTFQGSFSPGRKSGTTFRATRSEHLFSDGPKDVTSGIGPLLATKAPQAASLQDSSRSGTRGQRQATGVPSKAGKQKP